MNNESDTSNDPVTICNELRAREGDLSGNEVRNDESATGPRPLLNQGSLRVKERLDALISAPEDLGLSLGEKFRKLLLLSRKTELHRIKNTSTMN